MVIYVHNMKFYACNDKNNMEITYASDNNEVKL